MAENGSDFYGDTKNIQRSLGVQGQFLLDQVRTDMGMLLTHDIAWYLRQGQQRYYLISQAFTSAGAGVQGLKTLLPTGGYLLDMQLHFGVEADYNNLYGAAGGYIPPLDVATIVPGNVWSVITHSWVTGTAGAPTQAVAYNNANATTITRPYLHMQLPLYVPPRSYIVFRMRSIAAWAGSCYFEALMATTSPDESVVGTERMEPIR